MLHQFPQDCATGSAYATAGQWSGVCVDGGGKATPANFQNPGVFGGIVMGFFAAWIWQRYHRVKLVDWLGFFNGRRLVPIIMRSSGWPSPRCACGSGRPSVTR